MPKIINDNSLGYMAHWNQRGERGGGSGREIEEREWSDLQTTSHLSLVWALRWLRPAASIQSQLGGN